MMSPRLRRGSLSGGAVDIGPSIEEHRGEAGVVDADPRSTSCRINGKDRRSVLTGRGRLVAIAAARSRRSSRLQPRPKSVALRNDGHGAHRLSDFSVPPRR